MLFDLELQNIRVPLGPERALSIPRWDLKTGSHILLRGPSGSGKTTFLHLLAGLFQPPQGVVRIGSTRLEILNEKERTRFRRQHIGLIFQKLNLIDSLTVEENVRLGMKNPSQHLLDSALESVELSSHAKQLASELSLGEQQRTAVARLLAGQPDLILADEPTSSLDDRQALRVARSLSQAAQGKTLIIVSHDPRLVEIFQNQIHFEEILES